MHYYTTPIYYINGAPHIGHAFTTILGDALKKRDEMKGEQVLYSTGTDEHGQKNQHSMEALGMSAKEFSDQQSGAFKKLFEDMHIDFDVFFRTTSPEHKKVVQGILQRFFDEGKIIKKSYSGLYCEGCEQFKKPSDLTPEGYCPDHQKKPKEMTEENYFFPLEQDRQWLIDYIKSHPDFIQPAQYAKEVLGMLSEPLDDLCISRPKERVWLGIDIPFDKDYVTYIWFDALINYITTLKFGDNPKFLEDWQSAVHLIAKDILKPHCVYWPIMLKGLGVPPPKHCFVHGYWLGEGGIKMGKSLGNVVDPREAITLVGTDALRFYLIENMSATTDAQISLNLVKQGYKNLANNIGNLHMRVLKIVDKNKEKAVPSSKTLTDADKELIERLAKTFQDLYAPEGTLEGLNALAKAITQAGADVNAYFAENAPWQLIKQPGGEDRYAAVTYTTLEALRLIALAVYPIMPDTAKKILASLGMSPVMTADFTPYTVQIFDALCVTEPLFPLIEA